MKKIKSKLIQFYERDKKLIETMNNRKELNYNELIKMLLKQYLEIK